MYVEKDNAWYMAQAEKHYLEVNLAEAREIAEALQDRLQGTVQPPEYKRVKHLVNFTREIGVDVLLGVNVDGAALRFTGGAWKRFSSVSDAEAYARGLGFMTRQEYIDLRNAQKAAEAAK